MVLPVMLNKDSDNVYDLGEILKSLKEPNRRHRSPVTNREIHNLTNEGLVVVQKGSSSHARRIARKQELLLQQVGFKPAEFYQDYQGRRIAGHEALDSKRNDGDPWDEDNPRRVPPRVPEELPPSHRIPPPVQPLVSAIPHHPIQYHNIIPQPANPIEQIQPGEQRQDLAPVWITHPSPARPISFVQPEYQYHLQQQPQLHQNQRIRQILQIPVYQAFDENSPSGQTIKHMYETEHPGYEIRFVHDLPDHRVASSQPVPPAPPLQPRWIPQQPQPQHPPWFGWLPNPANLIPREAWFV